MHAIEANTDLMSFSWNLWHTYPVIIILMPAIFSKLIDETIISIIMKHYFIYLVRKEPLISSLPPANVCASVLNG